MLKQTGLCLAAAGLLAFGVGTAPASAAIHCDGPYQVNKNGHTFSTPYCEDNYLTKVARSYGLRYTARQVRWDPGVKQRVCEIVGHDTRVRETCRGFGFEDGSGFRSR